MNNKEEAGTKGLSKKYTPKTMNFLFSSGSVFFYIFIKINESGTTFFVKVVLSQPLLDIVIGWQGNSFK